jgi:hypothetical protein
VLNPETLCVQSYVCDDNCAKSYKCNHFLCASKYLCTTRRAYDKLVRACTIFLCVREKDVCVVSRYKEYKTKRWVHVYKAVCVCTCLDISVKPIMSEKRMVTASYSWSHKSYTVNNPVAELKQSKNWKMQRNVWLRKKNISYSEQKAGDNLWKKKMIFRTGKNNYYLIFRTEKNNYYNYTLSPAHELSAPHADHQLHLEEAWKIEAHRCTRTSWTWVSKLTNLCLVCFVAIDCSSRDTKIPRFFKCIHIFNGVFKFYSFIVRL